MNDPSQEDGSETETINVVPLADLTLVLLVILMVLSPMITQSMIHVSAPAVKAEKDITPKEQDPDEKPPEPLMIELSPAGYRLNNAPTPDLETLLNAVAARLAETPERPVLVSADKTITVGSVVEVLDGLKLRESDIAQALGLPSFTVRMSLLKKAEPAGEDLMASGAAIRGKSFGDAPIAGVNIVPVIDLCLVLLVILLVVSPMLEKPPVDVTLPTAQTKEEKENNISVTIAPDGRMAVNTEEVSRELFPRLLKALLSEQGEDTVVVIRADKSVLYGELTDLLNEIKKAGAKRISLGTEQRKEVAPS